LIDIPGIAHIAPAATHPLARVALRYGYGSASSGFGMHHVHGGSWVGHMIVSSIIHGLIYSVIFRVLRHLSLSEVVLLAVIVIGGIYMWNRNRGYRRW
jgi:hypothetical protein